MDIRISSSASAAPAPSRHGFEFRGDAREWFGIWIVNLTLTILTLGVYSAWAKVRARKYFYRNTWVAGRNFDYHATGLQILVGRIIVVAGLAVYYVATTVQHLNVAVIGAFVAALPWLITRSLRFNARMSSWSNVRFRFDGTYGRAMLVYIVYPALVVLSLYTTFPFLQRARNRFTLNHHSLGRHRFAFDAPIGGFYRAFLVALALFAIVVAVAAATFLATPIDAVMDESWTPSALDFVLAYAAIVLFSAAGTIYSTMIRNVAIGNLSLDEGGIRFESTAVPLSVAAIVVTNAAVVLCTLGLMLPWAQVRLARYMAAHTGASAFGSLDGFAGELEEPRGAVGDAYTDIEAVDVGLPI